MERSEIEARVVGLLVGDLGVEREHIRPDSLLEEDLGLESLQIVELVLAVEEACGVRISDEEAEGLTTVAGVVDAVSRLGG